MFLTYVQVPNLGSSERVPPPCDCSIYPSEKTFCKTPADISSTLPEVQKWWDLLRVTGKFLADRKIWVLVVHGGHWVSGTGGRRKHHSFTLPQDTLFSAVKCCSAPVARERQHRVSSTSAKSPGGGRGEGEHHSTWSTHTFPCPLRYTDWLLGPGRSSTKLGLCSKDSWQGGDPGAPSQLVIRAGVPITTP